MTKPSATVAVITRTKDRPVFLQRAIKSVANQTYRDYVHVIVNDGGDRSDIAAVLQQFDSDTTDKISVFHRSQASGAPDTIFSESIDRADSTYVAIHDDDDTWHSEFLQRSVAVLDNGAEGVVARVDNVYEKLSQGKIQQTKRTPYLPDLRAVSLYNQCLDNQVTALAFVYRRSAYEAIGKYDDSLPVVGDWEFGIRFLTKYDVDYLDPGFALAYYHRHPKEKSSFTAHSHRRYLTQVLNKYLRQDIQNGGLGIGYIMNQRWSERDSRYSTIKKLAPNSVKKFMSGLNK